MLKKLAYMMLVICSVGILAAAYAADVVSVGEKHLYTDSRHDNTSKTESVKTKKEDINSDKQAVKKDSSTEEKSEESDNESNDKKRKVWPWYALGGGAFAGGAILAATAFSLSNAGAGGAMIPPVVPDDASEHLDCVHGTQVGGKCVCSHGYVGKLCDTLGDGWESNNDDNVYPVQECEEYDSNGRCIIYGNEVKNDRRAVIYGYGGDGNIENTNTYNTDIYGAYSAYSPQYNIKYDSPRTESSVTMNITTTGTGNTYGVYSGGDTANNARGNSATGTINIKATNSSGNVYGVYSSNSTARNAWEGGTGIITITYDGTGDVYGLYGVLTVTNAHNDNSDATIKINANTSGNVYGLYGAGSNRVNNANGGSKSENSNAVLDITSTGSGNTFGLYGREVHNAYSKYSNGTINIKNLGNGNAWGMYAVNANNDGATVDSAKIQMINTGDGTVIGMYGTGTMSNSRTIDIRNLGNGTAIGMYVNGGTATNSGNITISRDEYMDYTANTTNGGTAYGVYVASGKFTNTETGVITISGADTAYGIYAETGATITNNGTINIDNGTCSGADCNTGNYIVLNGARLIQNGDLIARSLNLDDMGGKVYATENSHFNIEDGFSGELTVAASSVTRGANKQYILNDVIYAGDVSGLNVVSGSALFNASLAENGNDIVMNMRDFAEFTDNKSLAAFLRNNYAMANGAGLFAGIKSIESVAELGRTLDGFTGHGAFSKFAHQDMATMREIGFAMNEKLFENRDKDEVQFSSNANYFSFSGADASGSARFGLTSARVTESLKLGYGMAMANIGSNDDNGISRISQMGLFYMPMTYEADSGYELVVNPKAGFARSEYTRNGFGGVYNGFIEKRIFGLVNDLRYPFTFGGLTIAPNLGLNALVYNQTGYESGGQFGLFIPENNIVSVEAGLGLYAKYDHELKNGGRLTFNSGLMAYREFGDCYDMRLGIQGLDGTFSVYGDKAYEYRGAATFGFSYDTGLFSLYGNVQYFVDSDQYMNFKGGISYRF